MIAKGGAGITAESTVGSGLPLKRRHSRSELEVEETTVTCSDSQLEQTGRSPAGGFNAEREPEARAFNLTSAVVDGEISSVASISGWHYHTGAGEISGFADSMVDTATLHDIADQTLHYSLPNDMPWDESLFGGQIFGGAYGAFASFDVNLI